MRRRCDNCGRIKRVLFRIPGENDKAQWWCTACLVRNQREAA